MTDPVPPVIIFMVGALLVPFIKGRWKLAFLLAIPVLGLINLINIGEGTHWVVGFLDYRLVFGRVDRLSLLFGYIFHIISFIAILYSLHVKENLQHIAGLVYAGSALGAIFAGELLSFFVFWEMLTVSSIFLIWARRTNAALGAGFRYLLVHATGGLCLLAGIVLHVNQTGSIEFGYLGLNGLGTYLIFFGFGLNCALAYPPYMAHRCPIPRQPLPEPFFPERLLPQRSRFMRWQGPFQEQRPSYGSGPS